MCDCRPRTVRLHLGGRHFKCAYCLRVNSHPFFDPLYVSDGHAYCYLCGCFSKIENLETHASEAEAAAAQQGRRRNDEG
jgi:hypothetical protein